MEVALQLRRQAGPHSEASHWKIVNATPTPIAIPVMRIVTIQPRTQFFVTTCPRRFSRRVKIINTCV